MNALFCRKWSAFSWTDAYHKIFNIHESNKWYLLAWNRDEGNSCFRDISAGIQFYQLQTSFPMPAHWDLRWIFDQAPVARHQIWSKLLFKFGEDADDDRVGDFLNWWRLRARSCSFVFDRAGEPLRWSSTIYTLHNAKDSTFCCLRFT